MAQLVIDLDLDLFVVPPVKFGRDSYQRAPSAEHKPSPRDSVEYFYQHQLKLQRSRRIKGAIFDFHKESYPWWRRLILEERLKVPFEVIHVDAHDDLLTDQELVDFFENWTATTDKMNERPPGLSSGNYLAYAVANGWLSALTWVRRSPPTTELSVWIFKDFSPDDGVLETKRFPEGGVIAATRPLSNGRIPKNFTPDIQIPFRQISFGHYEIARPADYIFVARSPSFTPIEFDENEDLIRDRIEQLPHATSC